MRRAEPVPSPGRGTGGRSSSEVAAEARAAVARAVGLRGGTVREVRNGRRVELLIDAQAGRRRVRVISRRRGDWQTSILEGQNPVPREDRFWVFVDFANGRTAYFIAPEPWVVDDIRSEHADYLARNGGERARTKDSEHHRIQTFRVERWRERWDLLGLAEPNDGDAS